MNPAIVLVAVVMAGMTGVVLSFGFLLKQVRLMLVPDRRVLPPPEVKALGGGPMVRGPDRVEAPGIVVRQLSDRSDGVPTTRPSRLS